MIEYITIWYLLYFTLLSAEQIDKYVVDRLQPMMYKQGSHADYETTCAVFTWSTKIYLIYNPKQNLLVFNQNKTEINWEL